MGCCAGKLQFHKETKRQDKNEYLAAARAVEELGVVVLECWDDDTVTGDDFLGTVAVPLAEVASGKQLDLPLLAATLAPWPRKHGAPSLQVTFDLVLIAASRAAFICVRDPATSSPRHSLRRSMPTRAVRRGDSPEGVPSPRTKKHLVPLVMTYNITSDKIPRPR